MVTAIQICEAHVLGVLVPWNSWHHEFYKPMGTLHVAVGTGTEHRPVSKEVLRRKSDLDAGVQSPLTNF